MRQEERERQQVALRKSEEQERAELDQLSSRHAQNKTVLVQPHAFRARDNDMIATLFDKSSTSVDMLLEMVKQEEEEFVLTDDSNNLMQMMTTTQNSNTTSSTQRSRSMTLDSLGTFDTLDSIDMDFLNTTGPKDKDHLRVIDPCPPPSSGIINEEGTSQSDSGSSVASVYYSFRNSPGCSAASESSNLENASAWNLQNIGEACFFHSPTALNHAQYLNCVCVCVWCYGV